MHYHSLFQIRIFSHVQACTDSSSLTCVADVMNDPSLVFQCWAVPFQNFQQGISCSASSVACTIFAATSGHCHIFIAAIPNVGIKINCSCIFVSQKGRSFHLPEWCHKVWCGLHCHSHQLMSSNVESSFTNQCCQCTPFRHFRSSHSIQHFGQLLPKRPSVNSSGLSSYSVFSKARSLQINLLSFLGLAATLSSSFASFIFQFSGC
jgi:hypothetical protein